MSKLGLFLLLALSILVLGLWTRGVGATQNPKLTICHCPDGNPENCQTKEDLPLAAGLAHLANHEHDYAGYCQEVTPTIIPCLDGITFDEGWEYCPTPTLEDTPTATPTPVLTDTPLESNSGGPGDGRSDGKSDGKSDGGRSSDFDKSQKLVPCAPGVCGSK